MIPFDRFMRLLACAFVLLMCDAVKVVAACGPLPIFVGRDNTDPSGQLHGFLQVSIAPSDLTLANLVCLTQSLQRDHPSAHGFTAYVFDARYAADAFSPASFEVSKNDLATYKQLRAIYVFDPSRNLDYLRITPLGYERPEEYDTKLDLPIDMPRCRIELLQRCLLAFDTIDLDDVPSGVGFRGVITLTARLGKDGAVSQIRVITSRGGPSTAVKEIVVAVTTNLKVWRFEPAPRTESLRIVYEFGDPIGAQSTPPDGLKIDLPDHVIAIVTVIREKARP